MNEILGVRPVALVFVSHVETAVDGLTDHRLRLRVQQASRIIHATSGHSVSKPRKKDSSKYKSGSVSQMETNSVTIKHAKQLTTT